ncbi:MAG: endonuclease III [Elusimicrobiota bacterium]
MRVEKLLKLLRENYPKASCSLDYKNPFELLIATILSAQCTDRRVNMVTPKLFKRFPDAEKMSKAPLDEIKEIIKSTGFYNNKAKSLKEASNSIVKNFQGKVPSDMEKLLSLKGVARKTANVVLSSAFGKNEGIVVDTHVKRISYRLGLTKQTNPQKIEKDLMNLIEKKDWGYFSHALVFHGRTFCFARNPKCKDCFLNNICPKKGIVKEK